MVKIGFIVEGDSEKIVIESAVFRKFLCNHNFELVDPVTNAKGAGNLLPKNIEEFINRLKGAGAEKLYILTDSDGNDLEEVKARIRHCKIETSFIAVKALEAWFLADTDAMKQFLKNEDFEEEEFPEKTVAMPYERIKAIAKSLQSRGAGSKTILAKTMVNKCGFSIENAARHPNCLSAQELIRYFSRKSAEHNIIPDEEMIDMAGLKQ